MGSRPGVADPAAGAEEGPKRMVTVRGFAAGQTAVSRAQFAAFAKASSYVTDAERLGGCFVSAGDQWSFQPQASWRKPGVTQADNHPAVCLTWNDARAYVDWLREQTKQRYRLLSEAEREYAARAGSTDAYWWGDTVTPDQANFNGVGAVSKGARPAAPPKGTVAVKQHAANPFGLYNVHGNVWEWVQDCQHPNYTGAPADGSAWSQDCTGSKRGLRGGSWISPATALRSASRNWLEPDMPANVNGFRVARDAAVVR
jgi:formylglycine-generating enzyme required for sulfatase activity